MGNIISVKKKETTHEKIINTLDFIATDYIFSMNFENMKKLHDKKYCDNLVILTSDIIDKYYSELEIRQIKNRIFNGETTKNTVYFYQKKDLDNISNKVSDCNEIAKFYIKIGHLFSAILTTVSPEYTYTDPTTRKIITKTLENRDEIPDDIVPNVQSNSLCSQKLNILSGKHHYKSKNDLTQEQGIPELINLYYDTDYDHVTGEFNGMTEHSQKRYYHDLKLFYKSFTQQKEMPINIQHFSDIKLNEINNIIPDYTFIPNSTNLNFTNSNSTNFNTFIPNSTNLNFTNSNTFIPNSTNLNSINSNTFIPNSNTFIPNSTIPIPSSSSPTPLQMGGMSNDHIIQEYAKNIRKMIRKIEYNQKKLLEILNKVFVVVDDPEDETSQTVRISPILTEKLLQHYINETRKYIVDLYINCEDDFVEGIKLYEAFVENILLQTTQEQIKSLENKLNDDPEQSNILSNPIFYPIKLLKQFFLFIS